MFGDIVIPVAKVIEYNYIIILGLKVYILSIIVLVNSFEDKLVDDMAVRGDLRILGI